MSDLEIREIRYFVAVAEELNFRRAAARLRMAQPPLSKAIRLLEAKLGVLLLERTTRQVSLTPAGDELLRQGRYVLHSADKAALRVRRVGNSDPRLVVTVKAGIDVDLLQKILSIYREDSGLLPIEVVVSGWGDPAIMLRDGSADVALIRLPADIAGLDFELLLTEPRMVALPANHRLVGRRQLRRADLADEPVPYWVNSGPDEEAYWTGQDNGLDGGQVVPVRRLARRGPEVTNMLQLLEVVALGQGVAFLPASVSRRHPHAGLVYQPVIDLSPSTLMIAWPEDSRSRSLAEFVRVAVAACQQPRLAPSGAERAGSRAL
jgi:DNA-binding transcriptional LysR family regulator